MTKGQLYSLTNIVYLNSHQFLKQSYLNIISSSNIVTFQYLLQYLINKNFKKSLQNQYKRMKRFISAILFLNQFILFVIFNESPSGETQKEKAK